MPNFTRMLSSKFKMQNYSKYGTFKFKDFSRTFKGLEFFSPNSRTFKDFSRTL